VTADAVPQKPSPGSNEALSIGCQCPVLDNGHGRLPPEMWVVVDGCPVHAPRAEAV
jgi:hypothetical protein